MEESSNCGKLTAQLRRAKVWLQEFTSFTSVEECWINSQYLVTTELIKANYSYCNKGPHAWNLPPVSCLQGQ